MLMQLLALDTEGTLDPGCSPLDRFQDIFICFPVCRRIHRVFLWCVYGVARLIVCTLDSGLSGDTLHSLSSIPHHLRTTSNVPTTYARVFPVIWTRRAILDALVAPVGTLLDKMRVGIHRIAIVFEEDEVRLLRPRKKKETPFHESIRTAARLIKSLLT